MALIYKAFFDTNQLLDQISLGAIDRCNWISSGGPFDGLGGATGGYAEFTNTSSYINLPAGTEDVYSLAIWFQAARPTSSLDIASGQVSASSTLLVERASSADKCEVSEVGVGVWSYSATDLSWKETDWNLVVIRVNTITGIESVRFNNAEGTTSDTSVQLDSLSIGGEDSNLGMAVMWDRYLSNSECDDLWNGGSGTLTLPPAEGEPLGSAATEAGPATFSASANFSQTQSGAAALVTGATTIEASGAVTPPSSSDGTAAISAPSATSTAGASLGTPDVEAMAGLVVPASGGGVFAYQSASDHTGSAPLIAPVTTGGSTAEGAAGVYTATSPLVVPGAFSTIAVTNPGLHFVAEVSVVKQTSANMAASADPPEYPADAPLVAAGATSASTAVWIVPDREATSTLSVPAARLYASGENDGTLDLFLAWHSHLGWPSRSLGFSASADFTAPPFEATAALDSAAVTGTASSDHVPPHYEATSAPLTTDAFVFNYADAFSVPPHFGGTAPLTIPAAVVAAVATHVPPHFAATAILDLDNATLSTTAEHVPPHFDASSAPMTLGPVELGTTATFTDPMAIGVAPLEVSFGLSTNATHDDPNWTVTGCDLSLAVTGSATAGAVPADFGATATLTLTGPVLAASATLDYPTFSASCAVDSDPASLAAVATHQPIAFDAGVILAISGGMAVSASAFANAGTYTATVSGLTGGPTGAASSTAAIPSSTAVSAQQLGSLAVGADATFSAPGRSATVAVDLSAGTVAAVGLFDPGEFEATADLALSGAYTFDAAAQKGWPTYDATAGLVAGEVEFDAGAGYDLSRTASLSLTAGVTFTATADHLYHFGATATLGLQGPLTFGATASHDFSGSQGYGLPTGVASVTVQQVPPTGLQVTRTAPVDDASVTVERVAPDDLNVTVRPGN